MYIFGLRDQAKEKIYIIKISVRSYTGNIRILLTYDNKYNVYYLNLTTIAWFFYDILMKNIPLEHKCISN
jgi:hypothetical protein